VSPRIALTDRSGVNFEPESYQNTLTAGFGVRWAAGEVLWQGSYFEPLSISLSLDAIGEITGYGGQFRTDGADAGGGEPTTLGRTRNVTPPDPDCYRADGQVLDASRCFPRTLEGAPKRLEYSDLTLTAAHDRLYRIPEAEVDISANTQFLFPTSLRSRNSDLRLRTAVGFGLSRTFFNDRLGLSYGFSFTKNFYRFETRTVADRDDPIEFNGQDISLAENAGENNSLNTSFAITNSFGLSYSFPHDLAAATSYALTDTWTHDLSDGESCMFEFAPGQFENVCDNTAEIGDIDEGRALKVNQVFTAGVSWAAREWLSLALGMTSASPLRKPDSRDLNNPFVHGNRNGYTTVSLGAIVTLDKLYQSAF